MISYVVTEVFVNFTEIFLSCLLCSFFFVINKRISFCIVYVMVTVDNNNIDACFLFPLFKFAGNLNVRFVFTLVCKVTGENKIGVIGFLELFFQGDKSCIEARCCKVKSCC